MSTYPDHQQVLDKVNIIRDVFNYTKSFKGSLFVIKIEDKLMNHPYFPLLMQDVIQLHSIGIKIVLILGTRNLIDETLKKFGVKAEIHNDVRITTEEALPLVQLAAMEFSQKVLSYITANGAKGIIGNWVKARSLGVRKGIDFQHTGLVVQIRKSEVQALLEQGYIPLLPNIGWNEVGRVYNVSSNEIALRFCADFEVSKLFVVGLEEGIKAEGLELPEGVHVSAHGIITDLDTRQAAELLTKNQGKISANLIDFIDKGIEALRKGVQRVHLVSGLTEGSILEEVFSTWGEGTMIYANKYYNIRKPTLHDVPKLLSFMDEFIRTEFLISRTETEIMEQLDDYCIYEIDQAIQGCAALHRRSDEVAEIAAVAVNPNTQSSGVGQNMVDHLVERARTLGFKRVYILTTQAEDWFEKMGFKRHQLKELPLEAQERYNPNRNSKVMIREVPAGNFKI